MNKQWIITLILVFFLAGLISATTLRGTIYNTDLEPEQDVLVEINTQPQQKFLSKSGTYSFDVPIGKYTLTATKSFLTLTEEIEITQEGEFIYDLFLLPDFTEEEDLWRDTEITLLEEEKPTRWWAYAIAGIIVVFALYRYAKARKKYGPLRKFRKKIKEESKKTIEEHKKELEQQPDLAEKALEIIKKNDGRITQKELRKEMLYLSEAKVSLIVTELEHKDKIEKIKKGRGNVIILK